LEATVTAKRLVSDELWAVVEPLLPMEPVKPNGGRPRVPNRSALEGIVYVLRSGIPWRMLPREIGCSGVTCWRRLHDWQKAGVARQAREDGPHRLVPGVVGFGERTGEKGGQKTGPNTVDRGRPGSKRHLLVDRSGVPLAVRLTGAQVHDSKVFEALVDSVEPVKSSRGRPRRRLAKLHADKGYDYPCCRRFLRRRGIKTRIARRGTESSERLRRYR
jgi:transposase